MEDST